MKLPELFTNGILSNRGDSFSARITDSGRKVVKIHKNNGNTKFSAVQYDNGTVVKTFVEKKK